MINDRQRDYIKQLCLFLPTRMSGKRGTKSIKKEVLIREYFKLLKYGLGWRQIKHAATVRAYIFECQRRGLFKKYLEQIVAKELRFRPKEAIVDGSGLESRAVSKETAYSGKNHDVCTKLLLEVTPDYLPLYFQFGRGNEHDIEEWKRYVKRGGKLPYKVWQDKGYESGKL